MKNTIPIIFILFSVFVSAQTIPGSRIFDWSNVGYRDSIPSPSTIHDVMQFGAVGDGITDDFNAIRSAIDSLHGTRGVVYFPNGSYLIGATLDLPDSIILRGESSDSSRLIFNLAGAVGNGINISGGPSGIFTAVTAGAYRGSSEITVADPSTFSVGDFAELIENNGAWDTAPVAWADNSVGQILHITNISGNVLFFDAALRINYDSTLNTRVQKITPALEIGLECLNISRADNVAAGVCFNINFNYAANCWIRGIESNVSVGSHVEIDASTNISIRGSYFHHSFLYDGVSTHGYGITLFAHSGQCLIENNIMKHLRHSFSMQTGANGNVIAYNYSLDPNRSEFPTDFGADISLHGHFPYANLFEGNIVQNIQLDQTHGPNGPFNTFFRNRAELYGILMTSGAVQNDSMNFVGNEVTNTGAFMGNYTLVGSGHFEFGNNIKGTITPIGTTPLPDSSYYLPGIPNFFTSTSFPTVGIQNTISSGSIPARDRYLSGSHFTSCNDDITIGIEPIPDFDFQIYPNPASESIIIHQQKNKNGFTVYMKDLHGKIFLMKNFSNVNTDQLLVFPDEVVTGLYMLEIISNDSKFVKKVIVIR